MTLIAAWERKIKNTTELVVASDSRLSGGLTWDCAPKIMLTPRSDCVICFAGDTLYAYPIMQMVINAIGMHQKVKSRAYDMADLKGHIGRVLEDVRLRITDLPCGDPSPAVPEFSLVLAGYSWTYKKFVCWRSFYDKNLRRFCFRKLSSHWQRTKGTKRFLFVGDLEREAKVELYSRLKQKGKLTVGGLDMEPFEVLRDFIRQKKHRAVGGPPQVVKLYEHMNCMPLNVQWPDAEATQVAFMGRLLLQYERNSFLTLNPDTMGIHDLWSNGESD